MIFIYNCFILLIIVILSPYLILKFTTDSRYRAGLSERMGILPPEILVLLHGERPIWFHAASVGEVAGSARLIKGIRAKWPEKKLIVSTFTATGKKMAAEKLDVDGIIMLPIDLPFITKKVLKRIKPSILIMMETEIWPNIIDDAGDMGIPVVLVNGRISSRSFGRYLLIKSFMRRIFNRMSLMLMRSETDRDRVVSLGASPDRTIVTGNIKFDFAVEEVGTPFMEGCVGPVIIAGSTRSGEEKPILDIYLRLKKKYGSLRLVLAPRHIERADEVARLLGEKGLHYVRRSQIKNGLPEAPVLLLDTLGELASLYKYSDVVFVGGSLVPRGGHNVLEPALFGRPVLFGPHMEDFYEEAEILTKAGGGVKVKDAGDLEGWICRLLADKDLRLSMGVRAKEAVARYQGAAERTLRELSAFIGQP